MPLSKIQDIGNQVIPNLGRRNMIINGDMQITQKEATSSTTVVILLMIDGINSHGGGTVTQEHNNILTSGTDTMVEGLKFSKRVT